MDQLSPQEIPSIMLESKVKRVILELKGQYDLFNWKGSLPSSAYDTAFIAKIHRDDNLYFPEALQWILKNQNSDGSWGESLIHFDKLLSTLSCIDLLLFIGKDGPAQRGICWVEENFSKNKSNENYEGAA